MSGPAIPSSRAAGRFSWLLPPSLSRVARRVPEPPVMLRSRRRTVAVTSLVGAGLLGYSLSAKPGSARFYGATAAVAGVWVAGSVAAGPLHRGWIQSRDSKAHRPVLLPVLTGAGAFGIFYGAALVVRRLPVLGPAVADALRFADGGDERLVLMTTLANGFGEELFFRGAMYAALPERHVVASSTAVYMLSTATTRNPALVLAAAAMGTVFGLQRRASGGIQASVITHLTWSALTLRYLPPLFRQARRRAGRRAGGL